MWGEIELEIIRRRPKPEEVLAKWLPVLGADDRRIVLESAYREVMRGSMVPRWEVALWESTATGQVHKAYLQLKRNHPAITIEQAHALLQAMAIARSRLTEK
jgi:hypothetical protein